MRSSRSLIAAFVAASLIAVLAPSRAVGSLADREGLKDETVSPPGQVVVATINAEQANVLGLVSFGKLYRMAIALRSRPVAFNGGREQAVTAPDVLTIQEMSIANVEILQNLLNQRSRYEYQLAVGEGSTAKFLYNSETLTLLGPPTTWLDPCKSDPGGKGIRRYQFARFAEKASGLAFTLAGVHFMPSYAGAPEPARCRVSNVAELKRQVALETNPVVVGGDFNYRPVQKPRECDPNERSEPTEWWQLMTDSLVGEPSFVDAVKDSHNRKKLSMATEWTHEQKRLRQACNGAVTYRRGRIDYLFARGTFVAEAHADHPGWAGEVPGTRHPTNERYSDHRFVWGRFLLGGPSRPQPPQAAQAKGGVIELSWEPVENAAAYVLYRARPRGAYSVLERLEAGSNSFVDASTSHGHSYRYSIAAVGTDGAQGYESRGRWQRADAQGPQVSGVSPWRGQTRVGLRSNIVVRYDERVAAASVTPETIKLIQKAKWKRGKDRVLRGRVRVTSSRTIEFDPVRRLERKRAYRIVVRPVLDQLGNRGAWRWSRFST